MYTKFESHVLTEKGLNKTFGNADWCSPRLLAITTPLQSLLKYRPLTQNRSSGASVGEIVTDKLAYANDKDLMA